MENCITELKLYCPLVFKMNSRDGKSSFEVNPAHFIQHTGAINEAIQQSLSDDESELKYGLNAYTNNEHLAKKLHSIFPSVERRDGDLYGVFTIKSYGELSENELADVTKEIISHAADGWGEGFEQHPVTLGSDEVYISFWNNDDGYFLKPENEAFPEQKMNLNMGGM